MGHKEAPKQHNAGSSRDPGLMTQQPRQQTQTHHKARTHQSCGGGNQTTSLSTAAIKEVKLEQYSNSQRKAAAPTITAPASS